MTHKSLALLFLFLALVLLLILIWVAMGMPVYQGCLMYGIDFNGKNEWFGLFCN